MKLGGNLVQMELMSRKIVKHPQIFKEKQPETSPLSFAVVFLLFSCDKKEIQKMMLITSKVTKSPFFHIIIQAIVLESFTNQIYLHRKSEN